MKRKIVDNIDSIYFIGIGGISMSALAKYMLAMKKRVGGSDAVSSDVTAELKSLGAYIDNGSDDLCSYDAVIYTDAISFDNRQLKMARSLKKIVMPRGKFLREICGNFNSVTAVSGCHGKTTCTAMIANIYYYANRRFMAHIGGIDCNLTNFYYSGNDAVITEACEYKKNFLSLKPDISVVLNTDYDHAECYKSSKELKECYKKFALRASVPICLYGDISLKGAVTFGFCREANYYADNVRCNSTGTSFCLYSHGKGREKITINAYGRHNVLNAIAAVAAADAAGIAMDDIVYGLEKFNGVQRRMEKLGYKDGVLCIADYAHHPNEIKATVKTIKSLLKGEVYVVFQPHTYSRTKNLFNQFVSVLSGIKHLLIYKTYAAREYYDDKGSALTLSGAIKNACYGNQPSDILNFISKAREEDVILFLGAGDIYYIAKSLIKT